MTNAAGCRLLNQSQAGIMGTPVTKIFSGKHEEEKINKILNDVAVACILGFESVVKTADGNTVPVSLTCSSLIDKVGAFRGSVWVLRDISEQKTNEALLRESEMRHRLLFEMSPDGIMVIDLEGTILMCNKQVYSTHGFRNPAELIGQNSAGFLLPEDSQRMLEDLRSLLEHPGEFGEGPIINYSLARGDSGAWPASIKGSIMRDATGKPTGFMLILRDVTEVRKAEEALRESEMRYRTLFQTSPDGISMLDLQGNILVSNQVMAEIVGHDNPADFVAVNITNFVVPADRKIIADGMQLATTQGIKEIEFSISKRDGDTCPLEASASPIRDGDGKPMAMIAVFRDISDRKQAEEALKASERTINAQYRGIPIPTYSWQKKEDDFLLVNFNDAAIEATHGVVAKSLNAKLSDMYRNNPDVIADVTRCFNEKSSIKHELTYHFSFQPSEENRYLSATYGFVPPDLVIVHAEDITDQKLAETELASQKDELAERNSELEALYQVSHAIASSQKMEDLISKVLNSITVLVNLFQAEPKAGIFLTEGDRLRLAGHAGDHSEYFIDMHDNLNIGDCLCGQAAKFGKIIISQNSKTDPRHDLHDPDQAEHGHIIVPLNISDRTVGVLYLYLPANAVNISERRLMLLDSIGNRIATAIENVRLHEKTEELALRDPLTGLANRRLMDLELQKNQAQAKRSGESYSLVMMDLDHFKDYNDNYGHTSGDKLLVQIADLIVSEIREVDLAARYGGEEFLLILPDTSMDPAFEVAERIRAATAACEFSCADGLTTARISISLGVATWKENIDNPEILVARADTALYCAKTSGRNRAVAWISSMPKTGANDV